MSVGGRVRSGEKLTQSRYGSAQLRHAKLLEPVTRSVIDLVALAEVVDTDGDVGHRLKSDELEVVSGKWCHSNCPSLNAVSLWVARDKVAIRQLHTIV